MIKRSIITSPIHNTNILTYQSNRSYFLSTEPDEHPAPVPKRARSSQPTDNISREHTDGNEDKDIEQIEDTLNNKNTSNHHFIEELQKAKNKMEDLKVSKIPIQFKIKLMESLRDTIRTNLNCIQDKNKCTKGRIVTFEKLNSYSTHINMLAKWKEIKNNSRSPSDASTIVSSTLSNACAAEDLLARKHTSSVLSSRNTIEEPTDEQKEYEECKQENTTLLDILTKLRQTQGSLAASIEDLKDDITDFQALLHEKKRILDNKTIFIEELKIKISQSSAKKSSNIKILSKDEKEEEEENNMNLLNVDHKDINKSPTDKSATNINGSIFHEVTSKFSGLVDKMFGTKKPQINILTPEILQEISLTSGSTTMPEPKFLIKRREEPGLISFSNSHQGYK